LMELALKVLGRNSKPSMAGESEDVLALTVRLSKELGRGYQASDHDWSAETRELYRH